MDTTKSPDSINYYESYYYDSFVGDFSGEVKDDKLSDQQINEMNWCDEQKIENALEFNFDSFGPESMLFPANACDNNSIITNQVKKLDTIKESKDEAIRNELQRQESSNYRSSKDEKVNKFIDNETVRRSISSLNELSDHLIANNNDYDDLVSLSVAEPQLKQKLDTCFDSDRIRNGYELHAEPRSILAYDKSILHHYDKSSVSQLEVFVNADHSTDRLDEDNFNSFIENDHSIIDNSFKVEQEDSFKENSIYYDSDLNEQEKSTTSDDQRLANANNNDEISSINDRLNNDSTNDDTATTDTSNTLTNQTNLSVEDDKQTLTEDSFKRQSTLTKSQRKRVLPKYKFEEMPSTFDDTNLILNNNVDLLNQLAKQQSSENQFKSVPLNDNNYLSSLINQENGDKNNLPEGIKTLY